MKHLLTLLTALVVILLPGCAALRRSPEEKAAEKLRIEQSLEAREYRIDVDYMLPLRGPGKSVTGSYSLTIDGSVVDSYLPYFGVAYNIPYGGGKALSFKGPIGEYRDSGWAKDRRTIIVSTDNGEDTLTYTITVFDDGTADISVRSRNREDIGFRGKIGPLKNGSQD
ncbi:MAG: DUF4251 domain-containing protein [Bacteroidales bacterium]|nr:DUF4251 domain-containing protein [Bacteroidales bacterium]